MISTLMRLVVHIVALCLLISGSAIADPVNPHGKVLQECNMCHSVSGWTPLLSPLSFSHDSTKFPLAGRHEGTSCLSCHATLVFSEAQSVCISCHADVHTGQFGNSCEKCHTPKGWDERMAMQSQHAATRFPLVGRHAQLDCQSCHANGKMVGIETACVSCHQSDFEKTTDPSHLMAGFSVSCESCHDTRITGWEVENFEHTSAFPLTGGHANRRCAECHLDQTFVSSSACYDCHREDYADSREPAHENGGFPHNCTQCHSTADWSSDFDHQTTDFPLAGRHVETSCGQCHGDNEYSGLNTSCWSCHAADYLITETPDHEEIQLPHECQSCHTAQSWDATFEHNSDTQYELTGAHVQIGCKECHVNGIFEGTPSQCIDCHLADYNGTTSPDHDATGIGTQCLECHTTETWDQAFDHNNTSFPLTGQHVQASCQQCHVNGIFDGTPSQCIECHLADYNGTTSPDHDATGIGTQCLECHTTEAWDQAFDHNNTSFPLTGQHVQASCQQCHVNGIFEGTPSQCIDCHLADYNGTTSPDHDATGIGTQCLECHTTEAWDQAFDHNNTSFPLTGQHVQASCQQCHVNGIFEGTPSQCIECHLADYNGTTSPDHDATGIGTQCLECHTTDAWDQAFDHNNTSFPLTGQHVQASCQQCHVNGIFEGTPSQCIDCHLADYNGTTSPDHDATGIGTQCLECHTTETWDQAFDHNNTSFPLTGQHVQASCQQCHVNGIFEGTPSQCIDCHLADYNGTTSPDHEATGIGTQCLECHTTEAWDQAFDHNNTSFPLTGQHVQASCQQCHVNGIFEGTPSQCIECHLADYNGTTSPDHDATGIGTQCLECHTTDAWDQAFDHNNTSFPLTGQHVQASCQQCHVNGIFEGTPSQCIDCHLADYNGTTSPDHDATGIGTQCLECHTTETWDQAFDHNNTSFPLTGQHVQASCQQCHVNGIFEGTPSQCIECHLADYNGTTSPDHDATGIGTQCLECHTTDAWDQAFDHNNTSFPLTGQHVQASCQQCHVNGIFEGTPSQCIDCHLADYNGTTSPDHDATGIGTQCLECHTTEAWDQAFDHNNTSFPLTGQHVQASCQQCHVNGIFEGTPSQCIECHLADYNGTTSPDHDATGIGTQCLECHTTDAWDQAFDHNNTSFPLTGQHVQASCQQCHVNGIFEGTPSQCIECHLADYNGTTSPDHDATGIGTQCLECHTTDAWDQAFDHNNTSFPLTGQHVQASCQQCHVNGIFEGTPSQCIDCHLADYNGTTSPDHEATGIGTQCLECHTTEAWDQAFDHNNTSFPLTGQHVQASCQQCHVNGIFEGTPSQCIDCHLADYNGTTSPDHDATGIGTQCLECHTTEAWDQAFDHNNTSFPLTGQHVQASCQQCHVNGIFEGTPSQCIDCHLADYNGTTSPDHDATGIGTQCLECHTTETWDQAFDHNNTSFPLTGQHVQASCQQCHVNGIFEGTPSQCIECHLADYNGTTSPDHDAAQFPTTCQTCHSTSNWNSTFNHSNTQFPLTGQHITATCNQCHASGQYDGLPTACVSCHQADYNGTTDPDHEAAQFPTTCQTCHSTSNWNSTFNHSNTQFPLTGQHITATCNQCHASGQYDGLPTACVSCHQADYNGTTDPDHEAAQFPTTCQTCHSTNNWDATFNHNNTQFPLTGQHITATCNQCHASGQYDGLPTACVSCHQADYNGTTDPDHEAAQFPTTCQSCHSTSNWNSTFNHSNTQFPLTGAHVQATCNQCHASGQYDGLPTTCVSCHQADYNGTTEPDHEAAQFPTTCQSCHSTSNWNSTFNHSNTQFPLTGQHVQATCNQCHASGQYDGLPTTCVSCHQSDYNGTTEPDHEAAGFSLQCQTCHTTSNWDATFNHSNTQFPLTGQHVQATCNQCHASGQYDGLPTTCVSCHQADYNGTTEPDHEAAGFSLQCQTCHTTSNWDATFNHSNTQFPLTGAHVQATCNQCHASGQYDGLPTTCVSCHQADYNGTTDPDHEAAQFPTTCQTCHSTNNWDATFNHNNTQFPLTGQHVQATCNQCHASGQYDGLPTTCVSCHQADYNGTTDPDHEAAQFPTTCQTCHSTNNWDATFNHNNTQFPLTGQHVTATCNQCHASGQYDGLPTTCVSCHQADYNGTTDPDHEEAQFPTTCQTCHSTNNWDATFNHNNTQFPLTGQHVQATCNQCHASGQYDGLPTTCVSCHQADYNGTTEPDHEAAGFSLQCQTCHTTSNWDATFNHSNTQFPLTGAHVQATCNQCHSGGVYDGLTTFCFDCHLGDYNGSADPDHEAAQFPTTCQTCHSTNNWDATFNHNNTQFPLTGQHVQATCNQCHASGQYDGLPTTCVSCHQADYNGTTDPDHDAAQFPTTCQTCHSTNNWDATFNHNNTQFPLTGAHVQATCNQCHASGQYDGLPTTCVSCHQADYNGTTEPDHEAAQFPTTCQTCHSTSNWDATFNHNNTQFPLTGQHVTATCNQCHASGQYDGLPTTCVSCHQADYNGTTEPDHEAAGFSLQCQTCHTTSNWDAAFNHSNTQFPLTGAHVQATCNQCHSGGVYDGLTTFCFDCHLGDYNGSADPDHQADQYPTGCQDCHTTSNWTSTFSHTPLFPINSGAHRDEWNTCWECHRSGNFATFSCTHCHEHRQSEADDEHSDVNGYVWLSSACYSCHPDGRNVPHRPHIPGSPRIK